MNDYKEQRLQLVINGVVEYEIEVIGTRKGPTKPGASTRQERYHHAFTRLKRIAERRAKCLEPITWEIYEVYKSKVNSMQNTFIKPYKIPEEYSNKLNIKKSVLS